MALHKDPQGNIHDDMGGTALQYLPAGCVEITEAEAEAIRIANLPPPPKVTSVTMRKARLALLQYGLLDTIDVAMLTMPRAAQIEWEFASEVDRSSPLVAGMAAQLSLTEQQMDELFTLADTL